MATFGQRLRALREERKLTQRQFAKIFSISPSGVSMFENDEREPAFELVDRMATYFGVSADYLLGRSIVRTPEQGFAFSDGGKGWTEEEMRMAEAIAISTIEAMRKQQDK